MAAQHLLNVRSVAAVKGHGHRGTVGDVAAHPAIEGAAGDGAVAHDQAVRVKDAAFDLARAVDRAAHRGRAHVQVAVDLSVVLHDKRGLLLLRISQAALYDAAVLHDKGQRVAVSRHQGDVASYFGIVLKSKGMFAAVDSQGHFFAGDLHISLERGLIDVDRLFGARKVDLCVVTDVQHNREGVDAFDHRMILHFYWDLCAK